MSASSMLAEDRRLVRHSFGQLFVIGMRAYGINLLLLVGLGWMVPIAIIIPFATGFATGWTAEATVWEGAIIGAFMGGWMVALCGVGLAALLVVNANYPGGLVAGDELGVALVISTLVLHLWIFASAGAIVGGHYARKEAREKANV